MFYVLINISLGMSEKFEFTESKDMDILYGKNREKKLTICNKIQRYKAIVPRINSIANNSAIEIVEKKK